MPRHCRPTPFHSVHSKKTKQQQGSSTVKGDISIPWEPQTDIDTAHTAALNQQQPEFSKHVAHCPCHPSLAMSPTHLSDTQSEQPIWDPTQWPLHLTPTRQTSRRSTAW